MDRRLFLPVIIMILSVLLLGGLINYQGGSAQEAPEETPAPVIGDKETVVQDSPKADFEEGNTNKTEIATAPASTATMYYSGGNLGTTTTKKTVSEDVIVKANFSYNNSAGLYVTFNDTSQNASLWKWDFGDGNYSEEQNPIHGYALYGEYEVTLIAYESTENKLNNDSITQTIYLTADDYDEDAGDLGDDSGDVTANFTYIIDGLNVTFNDTSVNASLWKWDLGDGNYSEEQNPIHGYALYGEYEVTLIAYESADNKLDNDSITQTICLTADDGSEEKTPLSTQEVPEFPTIAIPMVAIIGMAFIFSRRQ